MIDVTMKLVTVDGNRKYLVSEPDTQGLRRVYGKVPEYSTKPGVERVGTIRNYAVVGLLHGIDMHEMSKILDELEVCEKRSET